MFDCLYHRDSFTFQWKNMVFFYYLMWQFISEQMSITSEWNKVWRKTFCEVWLWQLLDYSMFREQLMLLKHQWNVEKSNVWIEQRFSFISTICLAFWGLAWQLPGPMEHLFMIFHSFPNTFICCILFKGDLTHQKNVPFMLTVSQFSPNASYLFKSISIDNLLESHSSSFLKVQRDN